jgi:hypothetical protein
MHKLTMPGSFQIEAGNKTYKIAQIKELNISGGINGKISILDINALKYIFLNTTAHSGRVNKTTEIVMETDSKIYLITLFSALKLFCK